MTSIRALPPKLGLPRQAIKGISDKSRKQKKQTKPVLTCFLKLEGWAFLTGNPFMSLFTIFHSGEFTVSRSRVAPTWSMHLVPDLPPGLADEDRAGWRMQRGLGFHSHILQHRLLPQTSLSELSFHRQRLFLFSITAPKGRHHRNRTPGCPDSEWEALAAAPQEKGTLRAPQLPGCSAACALGESLCSRWCACGGCRRGELFLIVQVPVGV